LALGQSLRRNLKFFLLSTPLLISALVIAPDSFRDRMLALARGEADYNQTSEDGRIAIWKRGISYGLADPVFGVGPGTFITRDGIGKADLGLTGKWSAAHNTYVQAFAEVGLPGLFLFLGVLVAIGRDAVSVFRSDPLGKGLGRPEYFAALVTFAVGAGFLSFLYSHMTWIFLASLGAMVSSSAARRRRTASTSIYSEGLAVNTVRHAKEHRLAQAPLRETRAVRSPW
jgi:O-antigen ligase